MEMSSREMLPTAAAISLWLVSVCVDVRVHECVAGEQGENEIKWAKQIMVDDR